eukprot:COSAG03_NODE_15421_length_430_cov_0.840361_1_plen_43_part_10
MNEGHDAHSGAHRLADKPAALTNTLDGVFMKAAGGRGLTHAPS